ncbi:hypothetical protein ACFL4G_06290 [Thermodesulfobacteriota bacterium]
MIKAGDILRESKQYRKTRTEGIDAVNRAVDERMRRLVAHARDKSPFYGRLYDGIDQDRFGLRDLPVVNKRILMDNFDEAVTDGRLRKDEVIAWSDDLSTIGACFKDDFILANTSGTSGFRGYFAYSLEEWVEAMGIMSLQVRRRKMPLGALLASLLPFYKSRSVSIVATGGHYIDVLFQFHYPAIMKYLVDTRMIDITMPIVRMAEALNACRPHQLSGYPTAVEALAREQRAGRLAIKPWEITVFAEPLEDRVRTFIEESFDCPVYCTYGATENFIIAKECDHRRMHTLNEMAILEPVEKDLSPTPAGKASHTSLITNLVQFTQPLIRYDIGDSIIPLGEPCPCGSELPTIKVIGRTDDTFWLLDADRRPHALLPLAIGVQVADTKGVEQFQIRQEERDRIRILYIPESPELITLARAEIESNFSRFLADQGLEGCAKIEIEEVDDIPRTAGGKLRRILSLVGPP